MCYAYKPPEADERAGTFRKGAGGDEFRFARDTVPVVTAGGAVRPMRWDLVPAGFLGRERPGLAEALRKKNSRAKNPATGRAWGFSSYNARVETVDVLWAFRDAWRAGRRGAMPVAAFRERPNMDEAPAAFRGREYEVGLAEPRFLAALHDVWIARDGERLESCTVITAPSDDVPEIRAIWHERVPVLLTDDECAEWLDPATSPARARAILRDARPPALAVRDITAPPAARRSDGPSLLEGLFGGEAG